MMSGRPRLVPGAIRGDLTDGEVVVSLDSGQVALILNAVGDAVLELCDGTRSIPDIASVIRDTIAVPESTDVAGDVNALLEQLVQAGIVVMAE
jgi:hypothetical protein